jgi:signal transduction histidine kinase
MYRVVVPAVLAVVVLLCTAAGVWFAHVRSVAVAVTTQSHVAAEVLDGNVGLTVAVARSLVQPGLHVVIIDRDSGSVIDANGAGVTTRPLPGSPDGGGPPAFAFPPPGAPPQSAGMPPPPRGVFGPITTFALSLARIAPAHVDRDDGSIQIAPDGRDLALWLVGDVLATVLGVALIFAVAARNVTVRSREQSRALARRMSERVEAAERYRRFLAETGHELRTPLTVMAGYVDILLARNARESVDQRILDGMHAETTRMRALVEKMMTLARLDSEPAVPRLLDVATAAREAAQTSQRRYPQRDVRVHAEQTASIVIDADDFSAALGNLVENAVRYAPDSPIVIETSIRDGLAVTSVLDHGPGISPADREVMFDRFARGRATAPGEGLGLGLAIVRRVADRWNGTIACTSGEGSTEFRLTFPLADEEPHGVAR